MLQFYFLSILTNIIGGLAVSGDYYEEKFSSLGAFKKILANSSFRITLGVITLIIGFLKLLSVIGGDVPIVGDLLPALSGMSIGLILIGEYYKTKASVTTQFMETIDRIFIANKSIYGTAAIAIALIHFLVPGILFL